MRNRVELRKKLFHSKAEKHLFMVFLVTLVLMFCFSFSVTCAVMLA